jgi:hypothetical protein
MGMGIHNSQAYLDTDARYDCSYRSLKIKIWLYSA